MPPVRSSRLAIVNQSAGVSSRRARAGVAAAGNDQGQEDHHDGGTVEGFLERAEHDDGDGLPDEERAQPEAALLVHVANAGAHVGLVEGFHAAELLDILGDFFLGDVSDVVGGDHADKHAAAVHDGQRVAVVLVHGPHRFFLILVGAEGDEIAVHQRLDAGGGIGEEDLAEAEVVEEDAVGIGDIDDVDGFGIASVPANVVHGLGDGPLGAELDVIGGHEPPDALFGVAEYGLHFAAVLGTERADQPLGDFGGKLIDEAGAVVGVHGLDEAEGGLGAEFVDELFLPLGGDVAEDLAGIIAREDPEGDRGLAGLEFGEDVGDVGVREIMEHLAQLGVASLLDEFPHFGLEELRGGVHGRVRRGKMESRRVIVGQEG
jgi:hypothetical protein